MKKFSNISGYSVPQKPEEKEIVTNEATLFKVKLLSLMESFLSIESYGPVDRYMREGSIKITGKEMFADAVLNLFDEKSIKEQSKLLESLKSTVKDWKSIDNKIDSLVPNIDFKINNKVESLLERYKSNDDLLISVIENKIKNSNNTILLEKYSLLFSKSELDKDTVNKINKIYSDRIEKVKTR